jgi:SAM-dependent methyltransferase
MSSKTGWSNFWKSSPAGFNDMMYLATSSFSKSFKKKFPLLATDRVLDIGCGPGFFIDKIKDEIQFGCGIDISEKYIEICKQNFKQNNNLSFFSAEAYADDFYKKIITENKINRVVMLSVLQYYQNTNQVKDFLLSLKEINNNQKFSVLIADIIPTNHSFFADIKSILSYAIKSGYIIRFFKFILFALFSNYRIAKKQGFLNVDPAFFTQLGKAYSLDISIVNNLTIHSSRYSVLINF